MIEITKRCTPISWRQTSGLFASFTEELNSAGQMRTKPAKLCQAGKKGLDLNPPGLQEQTIHRSETLPPIRTSI